MSEWPKEITYKDTPALEYESGVILNADTKKIMKPATHTIFDVNGENSPVDANETKRELAISAAIRGLQQGAGMDKIAGDVYGGWETVVEAQARLALMVDKGHASTRAAEFVGKATGMLATGNDSISVRSPDGYTVRAESREAMRELVGMLRAARTPVYGGDGDE